jgi:hypothetical protein
MELRFSADAGGPKLDEAFKKLLPVGEGSTTDIGCEGCEGSGLITVCGNVPVQTRLIFFWFWMVRHVMSV